MNLRLRLAGSAALLIGMTLASYGPVYRAGFIDFDDPEYVYENDRVADGLTGSNIIRAFTRSHAANWHPLTWISHMIDVEMFGLDARGHHFVNVALHAANVVLLFLTLAAITGDALPSFVVAAVFAVHPVNVEAVAWVAQRKTTLSTLFGILAIQCYGGYVRRVSRPRYIASLMFFAASLLCKQTLVTMPFVLLLLDYWPLERKELDPPAGKLPTVRSMARGWWRLFPEKIPYLALAVLVSVITVVVQEDALMSVAVHPISLRLGNAIIAYIGYLQILGWPTHLAIYYPLDAEEVTGWRVAASLLALVSASGVAWYFGRRWRFLLVGWLWFLGTLVPTIGLVQVGSQSMADRYTYFTCWGLLIALVWSVGALIRHTQSGRAAGGAAAVTIALLMVLAAGTVYQSRKWRDTFTLFSQAVSDTERNGLAHRVLANQYMSVKDYRSALYHCEQSIRYRQEPDSILSTYGVALCETGSMERGIQVLKQSQAKFPDKTIGYNNLGNVYTRAGKYDLAIEQFSLAAAKIKENETRRLRLAVLVNWASALSQANRPREALEKYEAALAIDADNPRLLGASAEVDLRLNHAERAIERLNRCLELNPRDATAAYLLARGYLAQQDLNGAAISFERAIALDPNNYDAAAQLATVFDRLGRSTEAGKLLEATLAAANRGDSKQAKRSASRIETQLGGIALAKNDIPAAIRHFDRALEAWPDNDAANNNLAWLLATAADPNLRDGKRALTLARHVCDVQRRRDHSTLGTLAAAYAASGEMPLAIAAVREALALPADRGDQVAVDSLRRQLKAYEQGQLHLDP